MSYRAPDKCPICGEPLKITKLNCFSCGSALEGVFDGCRFCSLSPSETQFLLTFLKHRGSLKDVGLELGISYPTVRNMLEKLLISLDLESDKTSASPDDSGHNSDNENDGSDCLVGDNSENSRSSEECFKPLSDEKKGSRGLSKNDVLRKLSKHQITADRAAELLRNL